MIWYDMIQYHIILYLWYEYDIWSIANTQNSTPEFHDQQVQGERVHFSPAYLGIQTDASKRFKPTRCTVKSLPCWVFFDKDAVQITLIVLVAGLVTIAGGVAVPLGEWVFWGDLFFRGSSWWHGSHSWKTRPWTKGCRSQLHEVVRIPDPFIHPELASPWPDSSKLQAPSEVACSQSFWLENWSENDDHQNQSQWRTRHRFALCTHVIFVSGIKRDRWLANKCNKDNDRARDKEFGLQSCNHVGSLLHDYYLNSWEPPLGTMASCDVRKCSNATQDTTSKSWEFSQIWMVHCTKRL